MRQDEQHIVAQDEQHIVNNLSYPKQSIMDTGTPLYSVTRLVHADDLETRIVPPTLSIDMCTDIKLSKVIL